MTKVFFYPSRALVIPFSQPSIGPKPEEDSEEFASLAAIQQKASSAVGGVIVWGSCLKRKAKEMFPALCFLL